MHAYDEQAGELEAARGKLDALIERLNSEQEAESGTAPAPAGESGAGGGPARDSYAQSVSARERLFGSSASPSGVGRDEFQQRQRRLQNATRSDRGAGVER